MRLRRPWTESHAYSRYGMRRSARLLLLAGSLLVLAVLALSTIGSFGATARRSRQHRCLPHGAETIALNRNVRVYSIPEYVEGARIESPGTYACERRRGTTLALAPVNRKRPRLRHELRHVTLAGTIVAFVDFQFFIDAGCDVIEVVDMARQQMVLVVPDVGCRGKRVGGEAQAAKLVVNEHGSVAWITQTWMVQRGGHVGSVSFEVHDANRGGSMALLDTGAGIVPGSLRLAPGGEVTWLDAARPLYALLP
jgi:hypothetical protein